MKELRMKDALGLVKTWGIGGWFQRTMLQLTEIYDFFRECKSNLALDQEKLNDFHKSLEIGRIDYGVSGRGESLCSRRLCARSTV